MNIWQGHVVRYGVLYPMQTFSKQREVDFGQIPCFVERDVYKRQVICSEFQRHGLQI